LIERLPKQRHSDHAKTASAAFPKAFDLESMSASHEVVKEAFKALSRESMAALSTAFAVV